MISFIILRWYFSWGNQGTTMIWLWRLSTRNWGRLMMWGRLRIWGSMDGVAIGGFRIIFLGCFRRQRTRSGWRRKIIKEDCSERRGEGKICRRERELALLLLTCLGISLRWQWTKMRRSTYQKDRGSSNSRRQDLKTFKNKNIRQR